MQVSRVTASFFLLLQACSLPSIAGDLAYGEYLAGECVACHRIGADEGIPSINALPAPYFIEALKQYRDGSGITISCVLSHARLAIPKWKRLQPISSNLKTNDQQSKKDATRRIISRREQGNDRSYKAPF